MAQTNHQLDSGAEVGPNKMTATPGGSSDQINADTAQTLRVLIVEDETLVGLYLQNVLRELGHTVSGVAPSLRTALAVAAGTPSDLAIVDVGLAGDGGDGIDTAVALRERYGIPTLLMTGASFAEFGDRVQQAQPLGFLRKPYTDAEFVTVLNAAIDKMHA